MDSEFYRWLFEAVAGLILIGLGLSLFGQAVIYKSKGEKVVKWFLWGTLSLIVVNAGLCILVDSVKPRIYYEKNQYSEQSRIGFTTNQIENSGSIR